MGSHLAMAEMAAVHQCWRLSVELLPEAKGPLCHLSNLTIRHNGVFKS